MRLNNILMTRSTLYLITPVAITCSSMDLSDGNSVNLEDLNALTLSAILFCGFPMWLKILFNATIAQSVVLFLPGLNMQYFENQELLHGWCATFERAWWVFCPVDISFVMVQYVIYQQCRLYSSLSDFWNLGAIQILAHANALSQPMWAASSCYVFITSSPAFLGT